MTVPTPAPLVLVTGATGYVGARLVPRLLDRGYRVRVMVRDPSRLEGRAWEERIDVVRGDVLDPATLGPALADVSAAYYLVHAMRAGDDFRERDRRAASNFGTAAKAAGVERIIYLGGLGDSGSELSEHLKSRQETGTTLAEAGVPVTEFRAGVVVGSGSISFEIVRHLAERIPILVCPRWTDTRTQPIAIRNVLAYLVLALERPESSGRVIEIGGEDVLSYGEMMLRYARVRGLDRWMVRVPVLTPRLSSYWVHWTTPIPAQIARPLIEGLKHEAVVRDPEPARTIFPDVELLDYDTAVERALARVETGIETSWADAVRSSLGTSEPVILTSREGMIVERRQAECDAPARTAVAAFSRLGGENGWLALDWSWRLRAALDRLVGGVGFRRGRRHPTEVRVGDAIDFWRVEAYDRDRLLRLRAEMKVPGRAWLEFTAEPRPGGGSLITQTAYFAPKGLFGLAYWYALYPFHALIFGRLVERLARWAERLEAEPVAPA